MSETKILPCPQKEICSLPQSAACTKEQFLDCGMSITLRNITALLNHSEYTSLSAPARSTFLQNRFNVFIDEEETFYAIGQLVQIIKARVEITRTKK